MSQTYEFPITLANETPNTAWTKANDALDALATLHEGSSAPSTTFASQLWHDNSNNILYIRNQADSGWIVLFADTTAANGGLASIAAAAFTTAAPTSETAASSSTDLLRKGEADAAIYSSSLTLEGIVNGGENYHIFAAPDSHVISSIKIVSDTATASSDGSNNYGFVIRNVTQGNDLYSVAGGKTTNGAELVADTVWNVTIDQNLTMAAGDVLELQITENGTATSLTSAKLMCQVNYTIVH